jgi:sulfatase maturation enzyme AslB (radical SAM superfamily)
MIEFDWLIHYRCNYRCPYCFFEGMWEKVEQRNRYLPRKEWADAWRRISQKYGEIKLIITGGEPFMYPEFPELLADLSPFAQLSFDTNFSCTKEQLFPLVDKIDPRRIFLGLSFHPVLADLDTFLEKARFLHAKDFSFRVHYVTYPQQIHSLKHFKDIFTGEGYRFTPIPFRGMYDGKKYPDSFTASEKEIIWGVTEEIAPIDRDWANRQVVQVQSKDKLCRAGQQYARVDNDGSVYPCGNDYTKSREKYLLGNVLDHGFAMKAEPMVCRQETCPCEFRWLVEGNNEQ